MRHLFLQRLNLPVVGASRTAEHRRNLKAEFTYIGTTVGRDCCESGTKKKLKKKTKRNNALCYSLTVTVGDNSHVVRHYKDRAK